jgi:hypothetical protein
MADDSFRQEKQPVGSSDVDASVGDPLQASQQVRNAAASEVGNPNPAQPESGVRISGKVPQQFLQAQKDISSDGQAPRGPQARRNPTEPDLRATGSNRLEELIAAVSGSTALYEEITLPSQGRFYDGTDGPTDGIVRLRPMTGAEEQILATPRFVKQGKAIDMIFRKCMQEDFDTSRFLSADRTYILLFLRGISYTPEYDVELTCPFTNKKFTTTIDLNSLFVDECPLDFSLNNLSDTLPTSDFKFDYRLANGTDDLKVQEYQERKNKDFGGMQQADDTLLYRTSLLITNLEGLTNQLEILELLKRLPVNDVSYLRSVVNDPPFGVDTKVSITSPFSMEDFEVELPLEANFFFPKAKRKTRTTQ